MPILPWWIKPLAIVIALAGIAYAGWHERGVIDDAALASYKASVAQAQATQAIQSAHEQIAAAQITVQSEQSHVQAITSLNTYWANIMRQRTANGSGKVSTLPAAPRSINEIATICLPFAQQSAQTTQQLIDLQNWIRQQQSVSPPN